MVLHLHLSPAVFDYTDWTWLGKPHTCLYKTLQLTVHVRANENHEVKGTAWRAQRQNCARHRSGQGYKKNSAALKVPKNTVASIILKWKTFGTTRTLPRAGRPAKTELSGEKSLGERGKEEPKDHCGWAPEMHSGDGRKLLESQPSLQPSTSRGFMAEWPDGSLSSVQDTWWKPAWSLLKKHLKDSLVWWDQDRTFWP